MNCTRVGPRAYMPATLAMPSAWNRRTVDSESWLNFSRYAGLPHERHPPRSPRVHAGDLGHAPLLEPAHRGLRVLLELLALRGHAAVARPGHDQGERAPRVAQAEVQRGVAAHRQAAHVGLRDA